MITITYGNDDGFFPEDFESDTVLTAVNDLGERNLFIDGDLIEDHSSITLQMLEDASYIMVQNRIIGA